MRRNHRERQAIWSPDGKYVAIGSGKQGWGIYRKPSTGAGEWEPLTLADRLTAPKSWSPGGRFILYKQIHPQEINRSMKHLYEVRHNRPTAMVH